MGEGFKIEVDAALKNIFGTMCHIAYFYKGGVTVEWMSSQPIGVILDLQDQLNIIGQRIQKETKKS